MITYVILRNYEQGKKESKKNLKIALLRQEQFQRRLSGSDLDNYAVIYNDTLLAIRDDVYEEEFEEPEAYNF